jgi:GrpB-like predicted nucleotidyltransferase (UPF0157 family)
MPEPIIVVDYDPVWPEQFRQMATYIRGVLGDVALRIDHIGATAVPGLAAKPIIDIQISVASFDPFDAICLPLESLGYVWRDNNPDLTKRYFREPPGTPRTHIHVRVLGSWSEQSALLFRDYLRENFFDAARYADLKKQLAEDFREYRRGYVEAKGPFIWGVLQHANAWSQKVGWTPDVSDG